MDKLKIQLIFIFFYCIILTTPLNSQIKKPVKKYLPPQLKQLLADAQTLLPEFSADVQLKLEAISKIVSEQNEHTAQ